VARYGPRATAAVPLLTDAYLAWYWYPALHGGPVTTGRTGGLASIAATASTWIQAHATPLALVAGLIILTAATGAMIAGRRAKVHDTSLVTTSTQNRRGAQEPTTDERHRC